MNNHYHVLAGTCRSRTPAETLSWVRPKWTELGITRIANVTGLDHLGIPVTVCIRPNAKHLSVSQGKGVTLELAKISAMMEAVEAYHIENPARPSFCGSYAAYRTRYSVQDPNQFHRTPFDRKDLADHDLDWAQAIDLSTAQTVYIPHICTCIDSTTWRPDYGYLQANSNGLAAGNTQAEAICHALYEVIERDALCRWQQLSQSERDLTQVNLKTLTSDALQCLLLQFERANIRVKLWDITSAIGLPAFHCAIADDHVVRSLGLFTGTGAHWSREIAVSRALTEAAQSRLTLISGNRDDIFPNYYQRVGSSESLRAVDAFKPGLRDYAACKQLSFSADFEENQQQTLNLLQQQGCSNVWCVDHTQVKIGIPVVQVFVRGLQFNGARLS